MIDDIYNAPKWFQAKFGGSYHNAVAELISVRDYGDRADRKLFAKVARLVPWPKRKHLYAMIYYAFILGQVYRRDQDDKIAAGKMVWSDEWNTWIDKPEEP